VIFPKLFREELLGFQFRVAFMPIRVSVGRLKKTEKKDEKPTAETC